ncbi:hypothetical protein AB6A40_009998, partial [Gnathostoma spinigerum]
MLSRLNILALRTNKNVKTFFGMTRRFAAASVQKPVALEIQDDVGIIKINVMEAKENSLNEAVTKTLMEIVEQIEDNNSIRCAVLMSGKPNSFIAGADIRMLSKVRSAAEAEIISSEAKKGFERIERSKKPYVAAIMGTCMGGGFELALACHYRIAMNVPKTLIGLPEVMLGLLPGAGGTQRLARYTSIQNALDMMLTGKSLNAVKAKKIGIVDQIIQPIGPGRKPIEENNLGYLEQIAVQAARGLYSGALKVNRTRPFLERVTNYFLTRPPLLDSVVLKMAHDKIMKQTFGKYPAPLKILDVVKTSYHSGAIKGYEEETIAFGELTQTPECHALISVFNGSTECKKHKYGTSEETKKLSIIGAGLMGAGIANVSIDKGIHTVLLDVDDAGLNRGQHQIHTHLSGLVKRKKISNVERAKILSRLRPTVSYEDIKSSDVVIEAVFENLSLKHKVIKQIEDIVPDHCVVASNTSALPISDIAKVSKNPERIVGMHYFSPVEKMQLLEIIVTNKTNKETIATAANLGLRQKKLVVVVKDCPGFFVVRCLGPMMSEVVRLLQEGVAPTVVDQITKAFGFPVGASTLADEVGLDVAQHVNESLSKALGPRMSGSSPGLLAEMVSSGFKGRKSGKGIYVYGGARKGTYGLLKQKKAVNEEALKILSRHQLSAPSSVTGTEDQQMRIVSRFVNEAVHCLQEGVISSPLDGDTASVFGVGFPPFLGGPFKFIDTYGANRLVE